MTKRRTRWKAMWLAAFVAFLRMEQRAEQAEAELRELKRYMPRLSEAA